MKAFHPTSLLPVILIILLTGAVSCKEVLKVTGNYKEARSESPASVLAYLQKQKAAYDGAYVLNNKQSLKYFLDSINPYMPAIVVFDKDYRNYIIDYKCLSAKATGLDSLMTTATWKKNDQALQQKLFNQLKMIDSREALDSNKDYYVFYIWAKYLPKKSDEMIRENNALYHSFHAKLYVGAVNLDLQEGW